LLYSALTLGAAQLVAAYTSITATRCLAAAAAAASVDVGGFAAAAAVAASVVGKRYRPTVKPFIVRMPFI